MVHISIIYTAICTGIYLLFESYTPFPGFLDQEKDAAPVWWLESSSYPIEVLDKRRVKVLVRSDDLKKRYKHDPVIVRFEWGKGTVYHMISHFYLQRSETRTKKQSKYHLSIHVRHLHESDHNRQHTPELWFNAYVTMGFI